MLLRHTKLSYSKDFKMAVTLLPADAQSCTCYNRFHTFILNTQSKYFNLLCWITVKWSIGKPFDVSQQLLLIYIFSYLFSRRYLFSWPFRYLSPYLWKTCSFQKYTIWLNLFIWGGKSKDFMFLHRCYLNCLVSAFQLSVLFLSVHSYQHKCYSGCENTLASNIWMFYF